MPARCQHGYGSVELCLPTPRHTLVASLIVMLFLAAGRCGTSYSLAGGVKSNVFKAKVTRSSKVRTDVF